MGTSLEDLRMLQDAEAVADGVWQNVVTWQPLAQEVVGSQLARAVDSIGANTLKRQLMASEQIEGYTTQLNGVARQLNAFINSIKSQRHLPDALREATVEYSIDISADWLELAEDNLE